jgi:hypothetical protein
VQAPEDRKAGAIFREVEPEDLLKYGLIPEFVRRSPAVCPPCYVAYQCASPALAKSIREGQDEVKAKEAGDVCTAVIHAFIEEEIVHGVIDVMFPWWDTWPGLSPARPCKPRIITGRC